jgi:hypothetical protein
MSRLPLWRQTRRGNVLNCGLINPKGVCPNYSRPFQATAVMPVFTGIQNEITFTPVDSRLRGNDG